jgi:hypothetical protein
VTFETGRFHPQSALLLTDGQPLQGNASRAKFGGVDHLCGPNTHLDYSFVAGEMRTQGEVTEAEFRDAVRRFLRAGRYPSNRPLVMALGIAENKIAYGLTENQTRWRIQEMEQAGYDCEHSKRAGVLIRRGQN